MRNRNFRNKIADFLIGHKAINLARRVVWLDQITQSAGFETKHGLNTAEHLANCVTSLVILIIVHSFLATRAYRS